MAEVEAAPIGQTLCEKYRVRLIGRGGMGEVYEATHTAMNKRVALKVLAPEVAMSGVAVARFFREAQAASKIQGEHAVHVLDVATLANVW